MIIRGLLPQIVSMSGFRIGQGVGHLQGHIALVTERDREGDSLILDFCGDEDGISRAAFGCLELIAALFGIQGRAVDRCGENLRVTCAFALETELIEQLSIAELIVLDGQVHALVRVAEQRLGCDRFFVPSEL